ncbi:hypothetical protein JB92DRAFT_3110109 [Gautieria morchelliformis]|nr:hypothetical protein JB92DRAFT_3110109 [Gautieria morchelliformis]
MGVPDYNRPIGSSSAPTLPAGIRGASLFRKRPLQAAPHLTPLPTRSLPRHSRARTEHPCPTASHLLTQSVLHTSPSYLMPPSSRQRQLRTPPVKPTSPPGLRGPAEPSGRVHARNTDTHLGAQKYHASPRAPASARAAVAIRNEGRSSTPRRPTLRHPAADSAATDAAYQSLVASLADPGVGPNRLEWHSSLPGSQGFKVPRNPSGRRAHARNTDTHLGAQAYAHRPQHARPSPYAMRADAAADTTLPPSPSSAPHSRRRVYSSAAQKRTEQLRIPPIAPSSPCNRPGPRPRANYLSVAWPCSSAWQPLPVLLCKASPRAAVAIRNEGRVRAPHPTAIHPPVSPPHLAALLLATQQLRTPPLAVAISQQPPPTHRSHRSYSNTPPFPPQSSAPPRRPTQRSPRTSTSPAARRHPAVQGAAADAAYRTLRHAMFPTLALLLRVAARVPVVSNTNTRPGRQDYQALPYARRRSTPGRRDTRGGFFGPRDLRRASSKRGA